MPDTKITDHQVRNCKETRKQATQEIAAAKIGISVRSARRVEQATALPSQREAGAWRTRADTSNTDPYATKLSAEECWIKTESRVMIAGADPGFYDMYRKSADPDRLVPYVMLAGTPYQDLMAQIK